MKVIQLVPFLLVVVALALGSGGCGAKKSQVSERQRKEAAYHASEADFALNLRDWARAEGMLTKAVQANPEVGAYWLTLGTTRVRLNNRSGAKEAYQRALKAFEQEAREDAKNAELWLRQAQVLALLGRIDDGRALLQKALKQFPNDGSLRAFVEAKEFDAWIAQPDFKQIAL